MNGPKFANLHQVELGLGTPRALKEMQVPLVSQYVVCH